MYDLFDRLQSTKRRVIAKRQIQILKVLLRRDRIDLHELWRELFEANYKPLKDGWKAYIRDIVNLDAIEALEFRREDGADSKKPRFFLQIRLEWATEVTETTFFEQVKKMPKAKTGLFLQG
jgi:hypothetical protein